MTPVSRAPRDLSRARADQDPLLSLFAKDDPQFWPQVSALAQEPDPSLYARGLLVIAKELEDADRLETAGKIYQDLLDRKAGPDVQGLAQTRLDALLGRGSFGNRWEFFSRRFVAQCADPVSLTAFAAGGAVFRATRLAFLSPLLETATDLTLPRWGASALASGAGLLAETPVVASLQRWGQKLYDPKRPGESTSWSEDLLSTALLLGSFHLAGAAGSATASKLERAPGLAENPRWFRLRNFSLAAIPSASAMAGLVLDHGLATAVGLRTGDFSWLQGMTSLLQFHVAGNLTRSLFGESYLQWERSLELRAEQLSRNQPEWPSSGPQPALAQALPEDTLPSHSLPAWERLHHYTTRLPNAEHGVAPGKVDALMRRFRPYFPPDHEGYYSEKIMEKVCGIHCDLPGFHENLLEALVQAPNRGTKSQLFTVFAIDHIFATDALSTVTGNFDYAPLQSLLGHILGSLDSASRQTAMSRILQAFENGLTRQATTELLAEYGNPEGQAVATEPIYSQTFHQNFAAIAGDAWSGYRAEDIVPLFNFVYRQAGHDPQRASRMIRILGEGRDDPRYSTLEVDGVLSYARRHPLGQLLLQRLFDIFVAKESPLKLREISDDPVSLSTEQYITQQLRRGLPPEMLAHRINGTAYTAHLNDLRLARKVVSVFQDVAPYLADDTPREQAKWRLSQEFLKFAELYRTQHRGLQAEDLLHFLNFNAAPESEAMVLAWMQKHFDIQVVSAEEFEAEIAQWGKVEDCQYSLFIQGRNNERDRILVKDLPPLQLESLEDLDVGFAEFFQRVKAVAHEIEHWRHFSASPSGMIGESHPIRLATISREERLVSEIMASLEEFRWRVKNTDEDFSLVARRLGETLPTHFRGIAERNYFAAENRAKALR